MNDKLSGKVIPALAICLLLPGLLITACAPVSELETVPSAAEPGEQDKMVKISLQRLDGTAVEKMVERPEYGGQLVQAFGGPILYWDEVFGTPWGTDENLAYTNEELIQGDWARGPAGTGEVTWSSGGWMSPEFMTGGLAESWEIPDDETIVFHIRQGVRWHDKPPLHGREFDAHDVVYNIRRIYFETPSSLMWGIAGAARPVDVYAPDNRTVIVQAPRGYVGKTWEYIADWTRMFPVEVIKEHGFHNQWQYVAGTGPAILSDHVPMSSVTYIRNPDYWMTDPLHTGNRLPYWDSLKTVIMPELNTRIAAIRTGKIDYLLESDLEWQEASSLMATNPELIHLGGLLPEINLLGYRLDIAELPFADIRVRRALYMAIDNREILHSYFGGRGELLTYPIAPLAMFQDIYTPLEELPRSGDGFDNRKLYDYYPDEARQLLAEAGYPNGFKTEVIMLTDEKTVDMMSMIKAYWFKIGVDLKLDIKDRGSFDTIYQGQTHNEMLYCRCWSDQPFDMFTVRRDNTYNWSMVDDPYLDDVYGKITADYFTRTRRNQLLGEANRHIIDRVYYLAPPSGYVYRFWQPWMKNYHGEESLGVANDYAFKYVWIDRDLKKSMGY